MATTNKNTKNFGLDHGTTNTCQIVAEIDENFAVKFENIKDKDGCLLTPSVIYDESLMQNENEELKTNIKQQIIYGYAAQLKMKDFPKGGLFHIKRFMGEKYV